MPIFFLFLSIFTFGFAVRFIFIKKQRHNSILMAALFSVSGIHLLSLVGEYTGFYMSHPRFMGVTSCLIFLSPPLLFLHFLLQSGRIEKLKPLYALHFIPFFYDVITFIPLFLMDSKERLEMLHKPLSTHAVVYLSIRLAYSSVYAGLVLHTGLKFDKIKSSINKIYLLIISGSAALFTLISSTAFFIRVFTGEQFPLYFTSRHLPHLVFPAIVLFFFFKYRHIFTTSFLETKEERKYATSSLEEKDIEDIHNSLNSHIKECSPHLNPDVSLRSLSEHLGILPNHLSQVINLKEGCNFNRFINSLRVGEAERMIQDPAMAECTILEIATRAGFRSKSAFNTAFKTKTGLTPSQFKTQNVR